MKKKRKEKKRRKLLVLDHLTATFIKQIAHSEVCVDAVSLSFGFKLFPRFCSFLWVDTLQKGVIVNKKKSENMEPHL